MATTFKYYDPSVMVFIEVKISKKITVHGENWGLISKNSDFRSGFLHQKTGLHIGAFDVTQKNAFDSLTSRIAEIGVEKITKMIADMPTNEQAYQIDQNCKTKFETLETKLGFSLKECWSSAYIGNRYKIDVIWLDNHFSENDYDYDGKKCDYKGKNVSLSEYILIKYGKETSDLFENMF